MFVKNNTTGKYYINDVEVTKEEYQTSLDDFWANYVPDENVEPIVPTDDDYSEAGKILLGVSE